MTAKAEYRVIVVFEDELRTAARLLRGFFDAERSLTAEEATGIIEACFCALQGVEDDGAVVVLGRKPELHAKSGDSAALDGGLSSGTDETKESKS